MAVSNPTTTNGSANPPPGSNPKRTTNHFPDPESQRPAVGYQNIIRTPTTTEDASRPSLTHIRSHVSQDIAVFEPDPEETTGRGRGPYREAGDEVYDRLSPSRKVLITFVLSCCSFLAPISSTTVLSAVPEVAATFHTTGTIINVSNAVYLVFMGIAPALWGPLSNVFGRRWICVLCAALYLAFSVGTALAPNLVAFYIFRALTALQGTAFLVVGSSCLGDIYRPTERATALSWFLSGTLIGPALGPFIGGIIVTYRSWRDIFWLQAALGGLSTTLVFIFLPETIHHARRADLAHLPRRKQAALLWSWTNPVRIVRLYRFPNLLTTGLASSALVWNMYSLLTPIRYVLNPRFHLSSPMQAGLFYLAPGCGYLAGTFVGGRWADHYVKKYIAARGGRRIPEDRLRSCLPAMGVVIPGCMLIYGWSVEKGVGGVPLPVIVMFLQGVAQLFCFPSLNTYCLDVMQSRSSEVVAGNYMVRYLFAAAGSAAVLPAVEKIGVGWFSTISALFLVVATLGTWATAEWGAKWREDLLEKKERKKSAQMEEVEEEHDDRRSVDNADDAGDAVERPEPVVQEKV